MFADPSIPVLDIDGEPSEQLSGIWQYFGSFFCKALGKPPRL
jgi:hypothetical protein